MFRATKVSEELELRVLRVTRVRPRLAHRVIRDWPDKMVCRESQERQVLKERKVHPRLDHKATRVCKD